MHVCRSKQNVQDKVGPLEDSAGNIISPVFNAGRSSVQCLAERILIHYQLQTSEVNGSDL